MTLSPVLVVVAAMVSRMTWWLASGRARQLRVIWQNSRAWFNHLCERVQVIPV